MPTNPIPKGSVNLTSNIPLDVKKALERLAAKSGMKLGQYSRLILTEAVKNGAVIDHHTEVRTVEHTVVHTTTKPPPAWPAKPVARKNPRPGA